MVEWFGQGYPPNFRPKGIIYAFSNSPRLLNFSQLWLPGKQVNQTGSLRVVHFITGTSYLNFFVKKEYGTEMKRNLPLFEQATAPSLPQPVNYLSYRTGIKVNAPYTFGLASIQHSNRFFLSYILIRFAFMNTSQ